MKLTQIALFSLTVAGLAQADPFIFTSQKDPPDVLIGFRQQGSSSELVANLGSIFTYTQAAPGSFFSVTNLSPAEVIRVFPSLDALQVDIFAAVVKTSVAPGDPIFRTLWLVNPRTDVNVQTSPLFRKGPTTQGPTANKIGNIGNGAFNYSAGEAPGPDNTATWVVLPSDYSSGYSVYLGPQGDFSGTFGADTELTLPTGFATGGVVARLDFYQLAPAVTGQSNQGTYLGYFEFGTDASLSFHAAGGLPPASAPQITGITSDNSANTVTFSTLSGGYSYTLLRAPGGNLQAPIAQWTPVGSPVVGTGNPASLTDTINDTAAFYRVQVSP